MRGVGSHLNSDGEPDGVVLMYADDDLRRRLSELNVVEHDGDYVVSVADSRLPKIEQMPFLPVYRGRLEDGKEILELSGLE